MTNKYCISCGKISIDTMRICPSCGNRSFAMTAPEASTNTFTQIKPPLNIFRLIIVNIVSVGLAGFAILSSITIPLMSLVAFIASVLLIHFGLSKSEPRFYACLGHIIFCVVIAGVAWHFENEALNQFYDQDFRQRIIDLGGQDSASTIFINIASTAASFSIYKYAAIMQAIGFSLESFFLAKKK